MKFHVNKGNSVEYQKFLILKSGLVDNDEFNKQVDTLRKELGIPVGGLKDNTESEKWHNKYIEESDRIAVDPEWVESVRNLDPSMPDYKVKRRELHRELPINKLTYGIEDIISSNPDLTPNYKSIIHSYILFGDKFWGGVSKFHVFSEEINGKQVYGMKFYSHMSKNDFMNAVIMMELFNKRLPKVNPVDDIKRDIRILKLSNKKGELNVVHDIGENETDYTYGDESIVSEIFPESEDTVDNQKKNKDYIRKRRSLADKKLKELFPNTYKPCETE